MINSGLKFRWEDRSENIYIYLDLIFKADALLRCMICGATVRSLDRNSASVAADAKTAQGQSHPQSRNLQRSPHDGIAHRDGRLMMCFFLYREFVSTFATK